MTLGFGRGLLVVMGSVALLGLAAPAFAAPVIDVDKILLEPPGSTGAGGLGVFNFLSLNQAQTWTVGLTGTLDRVDLFGEAYGPTFDAVLSVFGGSSDIRVPGTNFLGAVTLPSMDIVFDGVTSFDFSALNIKANAGDILTMEIGGRFSCVSDCNQSWVILDRFEPSGARVRYADGFTFAITPSGAFFQDATFNFRTLMTPTDVGATVPEPGAWSLTILGFASLGAILRERRRRRVAWGM